MIRQTKLNKFLIKNLNRYILAGTMPAKNRKNWFLVIHLANTAKTHSSIKVHAYKKRTKIVLLNSAYVDRRCHFYFRAIIDHIKSRSVP
jgi:hypothetical protein